MNVRTCRPEEVAAVLELWRGADAYPSATDDIAGLDALLSHDAEALLVADVEGQIVGALIAVWDGWRGNMYRLAVAPGNRRAGVATELVRHGERRLPSRASGG